MVRNAFLLLAGSLLLLPGAYAQSDWDGDGVAWPEDCNDGFSDVEPGDLELCDGWDNDCDGTVDEGCVRDCARALPSAISTLGTTSGGSYGPQVASSSVGFDVVWIDERDGNPEVYLSRRDKQGGFLEAERRVTNDAAISRDVALAAAGDWRAIAWVDERNGNPEIYWQRLMNATFGAPPPIRVTSSQADDLEPSLAWTGIEWGVVWTRVRQDSEIHLARIAHAGTLLDEVTVTSRAGSGRRPSVAYGAGSYAVVWEDTRHGASEIYFRAYADSLDPTTDEIRITTADGLSSAPDVEWAQDRFVISWQDTRDGNPEVYAATVDPVGGWIGGPTRVTSEAGESGPPRIVWTGEEVLLAWLDSGGGAPEPRLARVSPDAALLEAGRPIAPPEAGVSGVAMAWLGYKPVVAWGASSSGEVAFTFPRCCSDVDGDGTDRCAGDCDDGDPGIRPGAPEACNGIDDDCDGEVDLGCDRSCGGPDRHGATQDHRVGTSPSMSNVDLAWNGGSMSLAWDEYDSTGGDPAVQRVYFQRVSSSGSALGPIIDLTPPDSSYAREPAVAAYPGGWAAVFSTSTSGNGTAHFRLLDLDGNPLGIDASWSASATKIDNPEIAWDGRGFGIVYERPNSGSEFRRLTRSAVPAGRVLLGSYATQPSIVWNGSVYAVAYGDCCPSTLGVARFDGDGERIESKTVVEGLGSMYYPKIVWNGSGYGVAFIVNYDSVFFQALDANADPIGSPYNLAWRGSYIQETGLAWTGEEYLVQWVDDERVAVQAMRLDPFGRPLAGLFDVSAPGGPVGAFSRADLVAVGGRFVSAWTEPGVAPSVARVRPLDCCPGGDPDGDGWCVADCDETRPSVHPEAEELCNGIDDDCDGAIAPAEATDLDTDGYLACNDCDDGNENRHPGAAEQCNGIDDDCDGEATGEIGPFPIVENLRFVSKDSIFWDVPAGPGYYFDAQRGTLEELRASGGDFTLATDACVLWNSTSSNVVDPTVPATGSGMFYLAAFGNVVCSGTWEDGSASQAGSRDAEVAASSAACP